MSINVYVDRNHCIHYPHEITFFFKQSKMRKYIILLLVFLVFGSCDSDDSIPDHPIPDEYRDFTVIPDNIFEQALIDLGYDDVLDGVVVTSNITNIETLDVSGRGIKRLEGIRDFVNLKVLWCERNNLYKLEEISEISGLKVLICNSNSLDSLNVAGNKNLTTLECDSNVIKWLIINESIQSLSCHFNRIESLDISKSKQLERLTCSENSIRHLDLSNNPELSLLYCQGNRLLTLNLKNLNNSRIASFDSKRNPELACIEVSDLAHAETFWLNYIDSGSSFSENCGY